MNHRLWILCIIVCLAFVSCEKKYVHEVVVVLQGDQVHRHVLNQPYTDPGAYGLDYLNKQLAVEINASAVNINLCGYYPVTITATDEYGNVGTAERTVEVYNELESLQGNWSFYKYPEGSGIADTIFIEAIDVSKQLNRHFFFTHFSSYPNAPIEAMIDANLITIDSLLYHVGPGQNLNIWFAGSGLQVNSNRMELNYSETTNGITDRFTALITRE